MKLDESGRKVYEGDGSFDFVATVDGEDITVSNVKAVPFSHLTSAVALPIAGEANTIGTPLPEFPLGTKVRVWSPKTNKSVILPVVAVSPSGKPEGSGGAIKLSSGAYKELGLSVGEEMVSYRVFGVGKNYEKISKPGLSENLNRKLAYKSVEYACKKIGVKERGTSNWGPEVKSYLASVNIDIAAPWCAAFIYYVIKEASDDLDIPIPSHIAKSGYTPDWKNRAVSADKWIEVSDARANPSLVKQGDLVLFYRASMRRIAHIEIVDKVTPQGVWCVGGNTKSQDGNNVERNGGEVARNFRSWASLGTKGGFVTWE